MTTIGVAHPGEARRVAEQIPRSRRYAHRSLNLALDLAPRILYTGRIRARFVKGGAVMTSGRPNIRGLHPVDSAGADPR